MSENKLQKYLNQTDIHTHETTDQIYRPVIFSDSKGNYLRNFANSNENIIWNCKGGRTTGESLKWLRSNLHDLVVQQGKIYLFVWTGTCDLTEKKGQFIYLKDNQTSCIDSIKSSYNEIRRLVTSEGKEKVLLTLLNIPYYSTGEWNIHKGHAPSEIFAQQDIVLRDSIDAVNNYIDSVNRELGTQSPKFNADLVRSRKAKRGPIRYSVNHKLLKDGVHPDRLLAQVWMKNIMKKIGSECYKHQ